MTKDQAPDSPGASQGGYRPPKRQRSGRSRCRDLQGQKTYAALDLGTNNCRMLIAIARPVGRGQRRPGFEVVDSFSRIVRLGEGMSASGELSNAAIERTLDALRICARKLQSHGTTAIRGVATEACRRTANGAAFLERVKRETGICLETISTEEESRLALAGTAPLLSRRIPRALVFDIGGGSTEITWVAVSGHHQPEPIGVYSLPEGVVTLAERYASEALSPEQYQSLVDELATRLAGFDRTHGIGEQIRQGRVQMLGTSGTVTTIGGLHLKLDRYDRSRVDGMKLNSETASSICRYLLNLPPGGRAHEPCIGPDRADLVLVGCALFEAILQRWPVPRFRIADRGIREGLLSNLIAADGECAGHAESPTDVNQVKDDMPSRRRRRRRRGRRPQGQQEAALQ